MWWVGPIRYDRRKLVALPTILPSLIAFVPGPTQSSQTNAFVFPSSLPVNEQMKICVNTISLANYENHNGDKARLRELCKLSFLLNPEPVTLVKEVSDAARSPRIPPTRYSGYPFYADRVRPNNRL